MSSDHWEISNLIARYAELLNLGQIEELGELFRYGKITSDGNPNTYVGTDEIVAMYRESVVFPEKVPDTLIFTSNLQVAVDGERASGKCYFMVVHQAEHGVGTVLAGRYHDRYVKVDGRWWFEHRHMWPDLVGDLSTHLTASLDELTQERDASV
jgi:hypothetical protein